MPYDKEIEGSKAVPYYTPAQPVPIGTAYETQENGKAVPTLFRPLKVRNMTLQNRVGVSPMCMYSTDDNYEVTPFHLVHYGQYALRGPGLTVVESTTVSPEGALSPRDSAIYTDAQAKKWKDVVDFFHAQGQNIGMQLGHGGRKASGVPPFVHLEDIQTESARGWPDKVVGPSPLQYRPYGNYKTPIELSKKEIKRIIGDFKSAAKRATEISGFDFVEIHGAHGYLICEFLSPHSNKRTDEYGGSFENRTRFLVEIIEEVRSVIPKDMPLMLRVSADENVGTDVAWKLKDTIELAKILPKLGVDIIDVSSGGNNPNRGPRNMATQKEMAVEIKKVVKDSLLVASVGGHVSGKKSNDLIESSGVDIIMVGSTFLKRPGLVWEWADELDVRLHQALQYGWYFPLKTQQITDLAEKAQKLALEDGEST